MKKIWPYILTALGVMIVICGFGYDVIFAGIPYQDPTPELAARYALHAQIAATIRCAGGIAFLVGVGAIFLRLLVRRFQHAN